MRKLLTSALLACAISTTATAQTRWYVDGSASGANNGTSWTDAFTNLGTALSAAGSGDTLWVASGFYLGNYTVPAGVTVMGRFLDHHVTKLEREVNFQTVLFGSGSGSVVTMGAGAVIDGLSIQGGAAGAPGGGGVLIDGVDCKVRNCFFLQNNDSVGKGAAMLVRNGANPRIENCVFYFNGDASSGAAVEFDNAGGIFVNNTVDTNWFSGLRLSNGATPSIYNSIFSNNGLLSGGPARGIEQTNAAANPIVSHNLFFNNTTSLYLHGASDLATIGNVNALPVATGNLAGDPQFSFPQAIYTLNSNSPAIDTGNPAVIPENPQGIYDFCRTLDGDFNGPYGIDIGASEYSDVSLRATLDVHTHVHLDAKSKASLPIWIMLGFDELSPAFKLSSFGYLFMDPALPIVVFPLPPSSTFDYNSACPIAPGLPIYFQAFTTVNGRLQLSMCAVHRLNC